MKEENRFLTLTETPAFEEELQTVQELEAELNEVKQGWKRSELVPYLAHKLIATYREVNLERFLYVPPPPKVLKYVEESLFVNTRNEMETRANITGTKNNQLLKMPPADREKLNAVGNEVLDMRAEYMESISELANELDEATNSQINTAREFLISHPSNISELKAFLEQPEFNEQREHIRPFLTALSRHFQRLNSDKRSNTSVLQEDIISRTIDTVHPEAFQRFVEHLLQKNGNGKNEVNILEWMALILPEVDTPYQRSFEDNENIELVAQRIRGHQIYPSALRTQFSSYLRATIEPDFNAVFSSLNRYNPTFSDRNRPLLVEKRTKFKDHKQPKPEQAPTNNNPEEEQPVERLCPIRFLPDVHLVAEEDLDSIIEKIALNFHQDPLVAVDIKTLLGYLRRNPYGPGVRKIKHRRLSIQGIGRDNVVVPLWRLRPDRVPISMSYKHTFGMRIVYTMEKTSEGKVLTIAGVHNHNDYEHKYLGAG